MSIELPSEVNKNIDIYEHILFDLNNFFVSLGIQKDPVKIYETFYYMVNNAYLSGFYEKDIPPLYYKLEKFDYIPFDLCGMVVLCNYGVCRHVSAFLNHIFNRMGYLSSQLFVNEPKLTYKIESDQPLKVEEMQKYIHETIKGLDLLYEYDVAYERVFPNVKVKVHYEPSRKILNHTMNIVKSYIDDSVYIFDANFHRVGFSKDDNKLVMSTMVKPGYTFTDIVLDDPGFMTYYGTNYRLGMELYNEFNSSSLTSVLNEHLSFSESIKGFIPEFVSFKKNHENIYREVQNNFHALARKI